MTDDMPPVPTDDDLDAWERDGVQYLRTLRALEDDGQRAPLSMGPFTGFNLLSLIETALNAPDLGRYRYMLDDLAGQLAPIVGLDDRGQDLAQTTAMMRELIRRESDGERAPVSVGPFTAMTVIGMLQLVTRHPEIEPGQRLLIQQLVGAFEPLFAGTPGEALIKSGYHPEFDQ